MRLPHRWSDYFLAIVMMSLAWPIRGQFGHLKGALIPGAAAAVIAAFLGRPGQAATRGLVEPALASGLGRPGQAAGGGESWKTLFPRAVIFSAIGFSLGGHLSYGWLIERLLDCHYVSRLVMDLARIFAIGAVWGGLGLTFLGFVLSEKHFERSDFFLLAGFFLFAFIFLDFLELESLNFIVLSAGLFILHAYNLIRKKSRTVGIFGLAGILGFGLGFAGAVFLLYLGNNGFLRGPWAWWSLRDQIFGAAGGITVAWAVRNASVKGFAPWDAALSLWETRAGFLAYAFLIPGLNTVYVIRHWMLKHSAAPSGSFYLIAGLLLAVLLFYGVCLWAGCAKNALIPSTFFFIGFLSLLAIAKNCFFSGFRHWEPGFTLFPLNVLILSILLPFRQK